MSATKPLPTVAALKAFYVRALVQGYASAIKSGRLSIFFGAKMGRYTEGEITMVDVWLSGEPQLDGRQSTFGFTVIFFRGKPIWVMWYYGWHRTDVTGVVEFLKRALATTREFRAGRGPTDYREGGGGSDLVYTNHSPSGVRFDDFTGQDFVMRGEEVVYTHKVGGIALVSLTDR